MDTFHLPANNNGLEERIKQKDQELANLLNELNSVKSKNDSDNEKRIAELQQYIVEGERELQLLLDIDNTRAEGHEGIQVRGNENDLELGVDDDGGNPSHDGDDQSVPLLSAITIDKNNNIKEKDRERAVKFTPRSGGDNGGAVVGADSAVVNSMHQMDGSQRDQNDTTAVDDGVLAPESAGCFSMFIRPFPLRMGFRFERLNRIIGKSTAPSANDTKGLALCITVKGIRGAALQLLGLVRPLIRIHAVDINTGRPLQSVRLPPVRAMNTTGRLVPVSSGSSGDAMALPYWDEELVLDLQFHDATGEKCVLLFELLDDKPSLASSAFKSKRSHDDSNLLSRYFTSLRGGDQGKPKEKEIKRVAWGFLLPLGMNGEFNVGFSDEWRNSYRHGASKVMSSDSSPDSKKQRSWSPQAGPAAAAELSIQTSPQRDEDDSESNKEGDEEKSLRISQLLFETRKKKVDRPLRLQLFKYQSPGPVQVLQRWALGWPSYRPSTSLQAEENDDDVDDNYPAVQAPAPSAKGKKSSSPVSKSASNPATAIPSSTRDDAYNVEEVYMQWRLQRLQAIDGAELSIALGPRRGERMSKRALRHYVRSSLLLPRSPSDLTLMSPSSHSTVPGHDNEASGAAAEGNDELDLLGLTSLQMNRRRGGHILQVFSLTMLHLPKNRLEWGRLRSTLLRRSRPFKEACVVPNKLLKRIDVGKHGAMVVSFSRSGHLLAVAVAATSGGGGAYHLRIYDPDLLVEVAAAAYCHQGPIYEVKWSLNDRYLLTSSGDGCVKVWDLLGLLPFAPLYNSRYSGSGLGLNMANSAANNRSAHSNSPRSASGSPGPGVGPMTPTYPFARREPPLPQLLYTFACTPPVFVYTALFLEYDVGGTAHVVPHHSSLVEANEKIREIEKAPPPQVICGASDGKIRVWEGQGDTPKLLGFIAVSNKSTKSSGEVESVRNASSPPPHDGLVNCIVLDERSRYLVSGCSMGDVMLWRCDASGWHQLLRKLKRDNSGSIGTYGVLSLHMHPDKGKGQMLMLTRDPGELKLLNMTNYKPIIHCKGYSSSREGGVAGAKVGSEGQQAENRQATGTLIRSAFSADGRYLVCGVPSLSSGSSAGQYRLQLWDALNGLPVRCPLSEFLFPYPVRSTSWHPRQHMLAITAVGDQAAVMLYCADKESAERVLDRVMEVPPLNLTQTKDNGDSSIVATPNNTTTSQKQDEQKIINEESKVGKSTDSDKSALLNSAKARDMIKRIQEMRASKS